MELKIYGKKGKRDKIESSSQRGSSLEVYIVQQGERNPYKYEYIDEKIQCEDLFHIRCHVKDKAYWMVIDDRIHTNLASIIMVDKLNLTTLQHPTPYKLP